MKHIVPYLIIASLLLLIVIILFIPVSETDSFPEKYNEQITTAIKKSDTLNSTIIHLNIRRDQLKAKNNIQQKESSRRIKEMEVLPVDSQVIKFKEATSYTGNISLKTSNSGDTLAEIPINSILRANIMFTELESKNIQNLLLGSINSTQDSIISNLQQIILNQQTQIDLLNIKYKQQNDVIKQKDRELKKQKSKHRLELICAGVVFAFIIIF